MNARELERLYDNALDIVNLAYRIAYKKDVSLSQALQALSVAAELQKRKELEK